MFEYIENDKNVKIALNATDQLLFIGVPSPNLKIKMLPIDLHSVPIQKDQLIERELASQREEITKLNEKIEKLEKVLCQQIEKERTLR